MTLTETGDARVNGYLFVLERSLKSFLPLDVVRDAVREIESHLRERIAAADAAPNERVVLERILSELGPPLRVAQAYSAERALDEAVITGRVVAVLRALWRTGAKTLIGFWIALGISVGYTAGVAFLSVAVMKPLFPDNVGIWVDNRTGIPFEMGAKFPVSPDQHPVGGYWVIPIFVAVGVLILMLTHRWAKQTLTRWRERRELARATGFAG